MGKIIGTMANKSFELGKCYRHPNAREMKIVGLAKTKLYSTCFVAEDTNGNAQFIGIGEEYTIGWSEIPEHEFEKVLKEVGFL